MTWLQTREFALYCEAKFVLQMRSKEKRRAYLELVEKARGMGGREALQDEIVRWNRVQKQSVPESGGKSTVSTVRQIW